MTSSEASASSTLPLKPLDIVLIHTGAAKQQTEEYLTDHVGMTGEATHWLLDQGIKMMGTDAVTFDPPVGRCSSGKQFWEAHRVMLEREYYHLENLGHLDEIPAPSMPSSPSSR